MGTDSFASSGQLPIVRIYILKKSSQKAEAEKSLENLYLCKPASAFQKFDFYMDGIEKIKANVLSKIVSTKRDTFDVIALIMEQCW